MGILTRFKDIMSSNINALLDKCEDPEKMIDQYLRNLEGDMSKVKAETASIMAEETRAKRELDECIAEQEKMATYAERAVMAGKDGDARQFLSKKAELANKESGLRVAYESASTQAMQMRQMHDKLAADIGELRSRKEVIKSKMAVAKTQERLSKMGASVNSANSSMSAFDRMEARANKMIDEANAMQELNGMMVDDLQDLTRQYDSVGSTPVDDELAALKAKLGK